MQEKRSHCLLPKVGVRDGVKTSLFVSCLYCSVIGGEFQGNLGELRDQSKANSNKGAGNSFDEPRFLYNIWGLALFSTWTFVALRLPYGNSILIYLYIIWLLMHILLIDCIHQLINGLTDRASINYLIGRVMLLVNQKCQQNNRRYYPWIH